MRRLVVLLVWVLPGEVLGRAGGGGGYGGGGGGFGGGGFGGGGFGGSFGGGGGDGISLDGPWSIGFYALVVAAYLYIKFREHEGEQDFNGKVSRTIREHGRSAPNYAADLQATATLRRGDPGFDPERFRARFREAFLKIQAAWQAQKLGGVRAFISDGIHERFSLQFLEQRDLGYRDQMERINVEHVLLAEVEVGEVFDTLTVQVIASAVDYRVGIADGKFISGSKTPERFTEYWSFVRKHGAVSTGREGLMEGQCPNCGTPLEMNQSSRCGSCQAELRSGAYDWVLAEITQACEWRAGLRVGADPVAEYRATRDPGMSRQRLEDRASVVFWRWVMAQRLGEVRPLAKMATDRYCAAFLKTLRTGEGGARFYRGDCAVGGVDLRGIVVAAECDYALVEVRWSGKEYSVTASGERRAVGVGALMRMLLVMARKRGVKTPLDGGIESAHCPSCGSAVSDTVSHACEYCGTVLNTGEQDWVLVEAQPMMSEEARAWTARLAPVALPVVPRRETPPPVRATVPTSVEVLAWMVKTLMADGKVGEKERGVVMGLGAKLGVSEELVGSFFEAAEAGRADLEAPSDAEEARAWLEAMADVALADGEVDAREEEVLLELAGSFGLVYADVDMIIKQRRGALFREARAREVAARGVVRQDPSSTSSDRVEAR